MSQLSTEIARAEGPCQRQNQINMGGGADGRATTRESCKVIPDSQFSPPPQCKQAEDRMEREIKEKESHVLLLTHLLEATSLHSNSIGEKAIDSRFVLVTGPSCV